MLSQEAGLVRPQTLEEIWVKAKIWYDWLVIRGTDRENMEECRSFSRVSSCSDK
jgi:hypothetical protein